MFVLLAFIAWATVSPCHAATSNDVRAGKLLASERAELNRLDTMQPETLRDLQQACDPARIEALTREILAGGSLFLGDRKTDPDGRAAVHHLIFKHLKALEPAGARVIGSLRGVVPVPVELSDLQTNPGEESTLAVGDRRFRVSPLWPNGVMPTVCPEGGLRGPLRYIGRGDWADIQGVDLKGAIVVMEFSGGRNWERAFSLGASGVVVLADDRMVRTTAEYLFMNTPVPCPRFYANAETAGQIREVAKSGTTAPAVLTGGSMYENRRFESIFAYLPPAEELPRYGIREGDLLERIGLEFNVSATELREENQLSGGDPQAGTVLRIPRSTRTYTVASGDLLKRLAAQFGLQEAALKSENHLTSNEIAPGTELRIPNLDSPLVLVLPIDSVNVAPNEPHGAKVASNLAVALTALDFLARPDSTRRRGVLVGFLDAEHLAGRSSRTLAEYQLLNQGQFQAGFIGAETPELRRKRYEEGALWFNGATVPSADSARWLLEQWITDRVENARIQTAEERIRLLDAREAAQKAGGDTSALAAQAKEIDDRLLKLIALRDESLQNTGLDAAGRLNQFRALLGTSPELEASTGLSMARLTARISTELAALQEAAAVDEGNRECAKAVSALRQKNSGLFGWYLSLGDGSPTLGRDDSQRKSFRDVEHPSNKLAEKFATRFGNISAYAAIRGDWKEEWSFLTNDDRSSYLVQAQLPVPYYPEFWVPMGVALDVLRTRNDLDERTDTPLDIIETTNFANLATQARTATLLLGLMLESAVDMPRVPALQSAGFGRVTGKTLEFNIRSGIDAKEPVPGVAVQQPDVAKGGGEGSYNTSTWLGMRPGSIVLSAPDGSYILPIESVALANSAGFLPNVYAYRVAQKLAVMDRIVDMGLVGTKKQKPTFALSAGLDTEKNLVMTSVYPLVFFPGTDPVKYLPIGGKGGKQQIIVSDAVLNGEPKHYAFVAPGLNYSEEEVLSNILLMPEGRRARIMVTEANRIVLLLVGEVSDKNDQTRKGAGYRVGRGADGERNLTVPFTPLAIAEQMHALAEMRQTQYKAFGIFDRGIAHALERSAIKIDAARMGRDDKAWQMANGSAREAWGILVRNYPKILSLGREAVFSAIILMVLMVPGSMFLERLLIGSRGIIARLCGAVTLFALGAVFLNFFHPAFKISVSPFIVIISFIMILMSVVVLGLSYGRFDVLMRRARRAGGEVEDESISLADSIQTALSLGLSNLKKRPSRTWLTTVTVSALTFSIIAFVSVKGTDSLYRRSIPLDRDAGGLLVEPEPPRYTGLLFREYFWNAMSDALISDLRSEFGALHPTVVRGFYIEQAGGNNSNREGINEMKVLYGKQTAIVTGLMTFEPGEKDFSGLHEAVTGGQWFASGREGDGTKEDLFSVILPLNVAGTLGITPEMVVDAEGQRRADAPVVMMNKRPWKVIGLLDPAKADRMRDINGKSLAMVDFLKSGYSPDVGNPGARLETESDGYHMGWDRLAIVPEAARLSVKGVPRSIAIKVPEDKLQTLYDDIALRLDRAFFGVENGEVSLLSNRQKASVGGIAKVILPVLLCILIVANTMLGTVEERKGEVGMLGAIGLSPRQISFLLLSESTVYSILGILFGIFSGFVFANLIPWFQTQFGIFGGLSFNFTSMLSMVLAMGAGAVVLLATLLPAMRAAALAAPSGMTKWKLPAPNDAGEIDFRLPFTLTGSNAIGVFEFLRRFLENHAESTSSDFSCRSIRAGGIQHGEDPVLELSAEMWLAPYDLDVSQRMRLLFVPTGTKGVFAVDLLLSRTSGSEDAWLRTNYGFLNLLRRQFLLWRNLDSESRERYVMDSRKKLTGEGVPT